VPATLNDSVQLGSDIVFLYDLIWASAQELAADPVLAKDGGHSGTEPAAERSGTLASTP